MPTVNEIDRYKDGLSSILSPEQIITDDAILDACSGDMSLVQGVRPLLVVRPQTVVQVQAIVRLSAETGMPIIPVSSGSPHFYGGTVPSREGVVFDFSAMNRILKIDELNRCVMIEPGVTYGDLIPEVARQGLKLNMPLLPRANKSVVAGCLERQPVLIPKYQYDYMDPLLTLGVVYGTGDEMRTGSASGPGDLAFLKADKVNPWGPGPVDYYRLVSGAQGTMGLVTWAMIKAEVLPYLHKVYFISTGEVDSSLSLVNELLRKRVLDECLILNNTDLAMILAADDAGEYERLAEDLPAWTVIAGIAGYKRRPEERVNIQERYLIAACKEHGLTASHELTGAGGKEMAIPALLTGAWRGETYWKLCRKGACQDIFLLSTMSEVGKYVSLMKAVANEFGYPQKDIGCYIQPMVQGRGCHVEFTLPYEKTVAQEAAGLKGLFLAASQALFDNGAFFSRPYGPWSDMVYHKYPDGVDALRKLKNIFDPAGILNPGKLCF